MTIAEIRQKFFEEILKALEENDKKAAKWYENSKLEKNDEIIW